MNDYRTELKISEDNLKYQCPKCESYDIIKLESLNSVQIMYKCYKCNILTGNINYFKKKGLLNFDRRIN